jgi:hypothetical protein
MSERKASERRRHPRTRKRFVVRFGHGDLAHSGYTQDISDSGVYLQANVIYPPHTILVLQIDYPEKTVSTRGVVRWSKDLPPAFRRSLRGGMGVEFTTPADHPREKPAPTSVRPTPARGSSDLPSPASESDLERGATRRRQVSTMAGNTFEVLQTEYRGAFYVRVFQLPRTEGSGDALLNKAFWTREEAERAVKDFLREH